MMKYAGIWRIMMENDGMGWNMMEYGEI